MSTQLKTEAPGDIMTSLAICCHCPLCSNTPCDTGLSTLLSSGFSKHTSVYSRAAKVGGHATNFATEKITSSKKLVAS